MKIIDAIGSAATQHAVYFLVTAYIESLRHFERSCGVPADALELPVRSRDDIESRARVLRRHTGVAIESLVAMSELAAVIGCAIDRLDALAQPVTEVRPHVRNDSRRSALSV